jgi:hypothetical protein
MKGLWGMKIVVWVGTGFFLFYAGETRGEDWRPKGHHYQIKEAREDCSVYRSVFASTLETLRSRMVDAGTLTKTTQEYFSSFQSCEQKNGVSPISMDDPGLEVDESCSESYESWLLEGAHLTTVEEEVAHLKEEVETLQSALGRKCRPTMVAELKS